MKRVALVVLVACGGGPRVAATPAAPVAKIDAACTIGVFSVDDVTFVFESSRVSIVRGRRVLQRVNAPASGMWTAASRVKAPDGGEWVIGVANGRVWRVTSVGDLEDVNARLGLGESRALSLAESNGTTAIGLEDGLVIVRDAGHAQRFDGPRAPVVAVAGVRVALARTDAVEVFDFQRARRDIFTIAGASWLGVLHDDTSTRFVVRSRAGVFVEQGDTLRGVPTPSDLRDVATGEARVWMLGARGLFALDGDTLRRTSVDAPRDARLCGAGNEGTWLSTSSASTLVAANHAADERWFRNVAPIFERVCGECHLPGGMGDLDLSLPAAWNANRTELVDALTSHAMPPPSTPLPESERELLLQYLRE